MTTQPTLAEQLVKEVDSNGQIPIAYIVPEVERAAGLPVLAPPHIDPPDELADDQLVALLESGALRVDEGQIVPAAQLSVIAELITSAAGLVTFERFADGRGGPVVALWRLADCWLVVVSDGTMSRYDLCDSSSALRSVVTLVLDNSGDDSTAELPYFQSLSTSAAEATLQAADRIDVIHYKAMPFKPTERTAITDRDGLTTVAIDAGGRLSALQARGHFAALLFAGEMSRPPSMPRE